jgi:kynurenine formamidase
MCVAAVMDLVYGEAGSGHASCDYTYVEPEVEQEHDKQPSRHPVADLPDAGALLTRPGLRIVDMTHAFGPDFPVLNPPVLPPEIDHFATVPTHGFNANKLTIDEHTGTHMDGPSHLDDSFGFADEIPPDKFIAPLIVIRIQSRAAQDNDTTLMVDDIRAWEHNHGRIPRGSFVVMDSGWAARIDQPGAFINRDTAGQAHFPGLGAEAVHFLTTRRSIVGAGVDTPSLDAAVHLTDPQAHRLLLGPNNRYGVENINNLSDVPDIGAVVIVGAIRHRRSYGGPVRMLAFH